MIIYVKIKQVLRAKESFPDIFTEGKFSRYTWNKKYAVFEFDEELTKEEMTLMKLAFKDNDILCR